MSESIFDDKTQKPDIKQLINVIGETATYWVDFRNYIEEKYGPLIEDWKFYNQKSGWILKVLRKKRNLFFVVPRNGSFRVSFVFGDKAVAVVESSDLPADIIQTLRDARKYMEGRGLPIEVKAPEDVTILKKLVDIKLAN